MTHASHIHRTPDISRNLAAYLDRAVLAAPFHLLCDSHTYAAGGEIFERQLSNVTLHNLGLQVKPTLAKAQQLASALTEGAVLIVFGSGTLTDIAKYAAHARGVRLVSIPSAASMNGYASSTASLMDKNGVKHSHLAKAPEHIFLDAALYAAAPVELTRAGLGDTLCRSTIQADALLAHLISGSWYDNEYFLSLSHHEARLLNLTSALQQGDKAAVELLMEALLLSGNAMQRAGSSIPASGSEHMIAHLLEKNLPKIMQPHFHGAQIALTTLTMARLQQFILSKTIPLNLKQYEAALRAQKEAQNAQEKWQILRAITPARWDEIWKELQQQLKGKLIAADELETAMLQAGLATSAEALGIVRSDYIHAVQNAFATRERISFLDVIAMRSEGEA